MNRATIPVSAETISFVRSIHAWSLVLIQAGGDRSQQENALRGIIEACNEELHRRGIDDASHSRLPDEFKESGEHE